MSKIYATDGKIITGDNFPQIQIGNKLYTVDNRKSTYDKIQEQYQKDPANDRAMLELALGKESTKEIEKMDLSVDSYKNLTYYVSAAIQGIEYDEVIKQIENARKN